MITYEKLSNKSRTFRLLTGINQQEFVQLLIGFSNAFEDDVYQWQIEGKERQKAFCSGKKKTHTQKSNVMIIQKRKD